jgi:hypothetical protein
MYSNVLVFVLPIRRLLVPFKGPLRSQQVRKPPMYTPWSAAQRQDDKVKKITHDRHDLQNMLLPCSLLAMSKTSDGVE